MTGRRFGSLAVGVGTAIAVIVAMSPSTSAVSGQASDPPAKARLEKFPQAGGPNQGSDLTRVGHKIYFYTSNAAGRTTLARIGQRGNVRTALLPGSQYAFVPPIKTSDGAVWSTLQPLSASGNRGIRLAGVNPRTWELDSARSRIVPLSGWTSVADRNGRYWSQGNVPGRGIGVVGDGLHKSRVVARTIVGPISSETDVNLNNPLALGPDGRVWLLGGNRFSALLRIVSIGPKGVHKAFTPKNLSVGTLAFAKAAGKMWTVAANNQGRLVAFGAASKGRNSRVPSTLFAECEAPSLVPVAHRGGLWFTGTDSACNHTGELSIGKVGLKSGTARAHATGLTVLGSLASTVVPAGKGAIAAGLDTSGDLAFARVANGKTTTTSTTVEPWAPTTQSQYPIVSDRRGGAWSQAVNAAGSLVMVHLVGNQARTIPTGLAPISRELTVGPGRALWTQGLRGGKLVLVKIRPNGTITKFATGLAPTQFQLAPTYDGRRHMWAQAAKPATGKLVLVRVRAR